MKKILLLLIILFNLKSINAQLVYICTGEYARVYHSKKECQGLGNCKANIISVFESDAINKYNLKRPCCICWYAKYGCAVEDANQPTKFNPYVPQGGGGGVSNNGVSSDVAIAALAIGAGVGAFFLSNDIYLYPVYSLYNFSKLDYNNKRKDYLNGSGVAFGFRKNFKGSSLEYGATYLMFETINYKYGFPFSEGLATFKRWGGHLNYIKQILRNSQEKKLNTYIGATINYAIDFGGGFIVGTELKLVKSLKLDLRYEFATNTNQAQLGLIYTFKRN